MEALADVDGTAVAVAALLASPDAMAIIDGDPSRLTGSLIAPYPRLRVEASASTWNEQTGVSTHDVRISYYGTVEGEPGEAALMAGLGIVLAVLLALPCRRYGPGQPVVYSATQYLPLQPMPEPSGRPRWQLGVRLRMRGHAIGPQMEDL